MTSMFDIYHPYAALLNDGKQAEAIDGTILLLQIIRGANRTLYDSSAKGTPFYVLGAAAAACHDYQSAAFYFDAAVSEDLTHHPTRNDTPALLFMRLVHTNPNQRAHALVNAAVNKLQTAIDSYNARDNHRPLTLDELRARFLDKTIRDSNSHRRTMVTALISFILEWDYRAQLIELATIASHEIFFMHLFKGCLLFESLLKESSASKARGGSLEAALTSLKVELGLSKENLRLGNTTLEALASSLVPNQSIRDVVVTTGQVRNMLGHNLVWPAASLDLKSYNLIADSIASACIHAISTLYI
ncbi:hypothetical protein [Bradyrhizobium sp. 141]|uniref:hypothetical protein n=1 Tax=Bradyrhizobium sp. 141 TaxID=2782617 RepID=UPI001FF7A1E6|nr:hypothetical protein [Bradyrhizobium sp. 141]MCK1718544.1 hypothetical protein [Bradyrhizobium sp. 141]